MLPPLVLLPLLLLVVAVVVAVAAVGLWSVAMSLHSLFLVVKMTGQMRTATMMRVVITKGHLTISTLLIPRHNPPNHSPRPRRQHRCPLV